MNRREFMEGALAAPALFRSAEVIDWITNDNVTSLQPARISPPSRPFLATLALLENDSRTPGIGIGVVRNGKADWHYFHGLADTATNKRIAADSVFPAASMGKTVFAYAVLKLAEKGRIDLDRPVMDYLKDDDPPTGVWGERVTARHCLSHSSGFPNWRQNAGERLVPAFEPGTRWQYSGEGYYTLQRCVENITGIGFEQFIQDTMLQPLGMASSSYIWRDDYAGRVVMGYDFGKGRHQRWDFSVALFDKIKASGIPLREWNHKRISAVMTKQSAPLDTSISPNCAFSLMTTVGDYTKFAARLVAPVGDELDLKPATRKEFLSPFVHVNSALSWGVGMGVEQGPTTHGLNFQWGDGGNWKNMLLVHSDTRSAIAVFTNSEIGMRLVERVVRTTTGSDNEIFILL